MKPLFILKLLVLICVLWGGTKAAGNAQDRVINVDSLAEAAPSTKQKKPPKIKVERPWPDPKKAVLLSAALPGAGQVYNKRWWKLPIVYGAYGGLTYAIIFNTQQFNRLQTAYLLALDGEEHEFTGTSIDNPTALRTLRDQYDRTRQLSYIGLFFAYVLTGVDAFVDAHLRRFDINDDLSLRLEPKLDLMQGQPQFGVGLNFTF